MRSRTTRVVLSLVAVAALVVLGFVVLQGDDENGSGAGAPATASGGDGGGGREKPADGKGQGGNGAPEPAPPTIVIRDGQPVGGVAELTYTHGETIEFVVESDTTAEVHLHGYDVTAGVEAGGEVRFEVPAEVEGIFEVELEETATPIAEVTVNPD